MRETSSPFPECTGTGCISFCSCGIIHVVDTSLNFGLDWLWFIAWIAIALFVLLASSLLPGRLKSLVWVLPAAAAIVMLGIGGVSDWRFRDHENACGPLGRL
jgi:hypothetical protein